MRYIEAEFTNGLGQSMKHYEVFEDSVSDVDISFNQHLVDIYNAYCDESMPSVVSEVFDDYNDNCHWDWCELDQAEWEALAYNTFCYMYKFDNGECIKYFRDEYEAAEHWANGLDTETYQNEVEEYVNWNYNAYKVLKHNISLEDLEREFLYYIAQEIAFGGFEHYTRLGD